MAMAAGALGVHVGAGCKGVEEINKFTEWLGRRPAMSMDGFAMESCDALRKDSSWAIRSWSLGKIPMSFAVPMLPTGSTDTLADGAAGTFDDVFQHIAKELVKYGYADAIVRIGWEFNAR